MNFTIQPGPAPAAGQAIKHPSGVGTDSLFYFSLLYHVPNVHPMVMNINDGYLNATNSNRNTDANVTNQISHDDNRQEFRSLYSPQLSDRK